MLFTVKIELLLSVIVSTIFTISCECRQSYMTICDNFDDLKNYVDKESLSEVIIGSEQGNMTSVHLMKALQIQSYNKLSILIIIRAINQIEMSYAFECSYNRSPLKYFGMYGNELKTIEEYHFPVFPMVKFSLVNNKIEAIKGGSFTHHKVENIDLSDNAMEVIESEALPMTSVTKIVTIKNNKLTHIEPGSFPASLQSLNLDRNKLRYLQKEILEGLVNLQELTLSHNKFNEIPNISHLKDLVVFDISSNAISSIKSGTFASMAKLQALDLSNNKLYDSSILSKLHVPEKQPTLEISLALNHLRNLNLKNVPLEKKTIILHGNPWDCDTWFDLKKQLKGYENKCDSDLLSTGNTPYCINYHSEFYIFSSSMWKMDVDIFHDSVRKSAAKSKCSLAPRKYYWLYPTGFGCVT
ncbi:hypothetical protein MTP99_013014 [Tenebrio molitor]|jgi:Leucine-rich repeat (LRR) protein|nr:hypothetical protein MTP99_013014 [Tenebrio molitor]